MIKLLTAAAIFGVLGGAAFAQADMAPPNVACSDFLAMGPDEQMLALSDAATALEAPAAGNMAGGQMAPAEPQAGGPTPADQMAGDQQPSADMLEGVVAACTSDSTMTLGAAVEEAGQN